MQHQTKLCNRHLHIVTQCIRFCSRQNWRVESQGSETNEEESFVEVKESQFGLETNTRC